MGMLDMIFGRRKTDTSASVAKQRLVEVLVQDHVKVTPEVMEAIRADISKVLAKHLDAETGQVQVNITRSENGDNLVANVPVRRMAGSRR